MEIYWDDNGQLTAQQTELLTRVATVAVAYVSETDATEVSISFADNDEIRVLNRDYRDKNAATDVLSFPVNAEFIIGPDRPLGDIVICMDVARQQANDYGHSLERELAFLVAHGMLHLLGFDHETPESEAQMCEAQDMILGQLGIHR